MAETPLDPSLKPPQRYSLRDEEHRPLALLLRFCWADIISTMVPEDYNPEELELVVFMTLPFGINESIIPGLLASRGIPVYVSERYLARRGQYVEIRVPASRLEDARRALDDAKSVGEQLKPEGDD
jgi:hypothetical protein